MKSWKRGKKIFLCIMISTAILCSTVCFSSCNLFKSLPDAVSDKATDAENTPSGRIKIDDKTADDAMPEYYKDFVWNKLHVSEWMQKYLENAAKDEEITVILCGYDANITWEKDFFDYVGALGIEILDGGVIRITPRKLATLFDDLLNAGAEKEWNIEYLRVRLSTPSGQCIEKYTNYCGVYVTEEFLKKLAQASPETTFPVYIYGYDYLQTFMYQGKSMTELYDEYARMMEIVNQTATLYYRMAECSSENEFDEVLHKYFPGDEGLRYKKDGVVLYDVIMQDLMCAEEEYEKLIEEEASLNEKVGKTGVAFPFFVYNGKTGAEYEEAYSLALEKRGVLDTLITMAEIGYNAEKMRDVIGVIGEDALAKYYFEGTFYADAIKGDIKNFEADIKAYAKAVNAWEEQQKQHIIADAELAEKQLIEDLLQKSSLVFDRIEMLKTLIEEYEKTPDAEHTDVSPEELYATFEAIVGTEIAKKYQKDTFCVADVLTCHDDLAKESVSMSDGIKEAEEAYMTWLEKNSFRSYLKKIHISIDETGNVFLTKAQIETLQDDLTAAGAGELFRLELFVRDATQMRIDKAE